MLLRVRSPHRKHRQHRNMNPPLYVGAFALPAGIVAAWMAWPALTDNFKETTFGIKPQTHDAPAAAQATPGSTKYVYEKLEIGERPSLVN